MHLIAEDPGWYGAGRPVGVRHRPSLAKRHRQLSLPKIARKNEEDVEGEDDEADDRVDQLSAGNLYEDER